MEINITMSFDNLIKDKPAVELPLTVTRGPIRKVHKKAGLNWGQRPGREPNQAYIPVPKKIHKANPGFFLAGAKEFTVITDDGDSFICVMAQGDKGYEKAIECPRNNSILGVYFRNRLGVPLDKKVKTKDLITYGRSTVTLYKIDASTFGLDFRI